MNRSFPSVLLLRVILFPFGSQHVVRRSSVDLETTRYSSIDHQSSSRRLVVGGSIPIVDRISKRSVAVFGQFGVATQYMLLVLCAACVGPAGPGCIELPGRWLVLICEEGLVPPINTNSSDKRFRQSVGYKGEDEGGKRESWQLTSR